MWVARLGVTVDMRASRIGETEQSCHFVETFAGGIVKGGTDHIDVPGHIFNVQQRSVAT